MLQQVRKQIVEKIVSDVGDRHPEIPYGSLYIIADLELNKTFSSIESRVQKVLTMEQKRKDDERDAHAAAMRANDNEGY